jgi:hypothetical protein
VVSEHRTTSKGAADPGVPAQKLVDLLIKSLGELAAAGEVEAACRLAGQACVALRHSDQKAARRFDVLLHRLSPKLTW